MVERFFKGGANSESTADGVMLLSGPPGCGKTSLMFQYALNLLSSHSDSHSYVVFLCLRPRLHSHPPFLSQGLDPSSEIFGRIHLKYLDDCPDVALHNYFAAFHLLSPAPLAVLVHDFSHFYHHSQCQQRFNNARGKDLAMVRVLALSHSALLHAKFILLPTHFTFFFFNPYVPPSSSPHFLYLFLLAKLPLASSSSLILTMETRPSFSFTKHGFLPSTLSKLMDLALFF